MSKKIDDKVYVALSGDRYGIAYGIDSEDAHTAVMNSLLSRTGELEKPVKFTVYLASPDWKLEWDNIVASELTKICEVELPIDKANAFLDAHGDIETIVMIAEENSEPEVMGAA